MSYEAEMIYIIKTVYQVGYTNGFKAATAGQPTNWTLYNPTVDAHLAGELAAHVDRIAATTVGRHERPWGEVV